MALIKKSEFESMAKEQLQSKLVELRKEMIKLNTQRSTGTTIENPGRVALIRRTIARIHTYMTQQKNKPVKEEKKPVVKKEKKEEKIPTKKVVQKKGGNKNK